MTSLGFYWPRNSPGKRDGDEFAREANNWADAQSGAEDVHMYRVQGTRKNSRALICEAIEHHAPVAMVACFCHGWPHRIQGSFSMEDNTNRELQSALNLHGLPDVRVVFYCCSTAHDNDGVDECPYADVEAATDGGFAWTIAHGLGERAIVDAHYFAGHTTRQPYVVRFTNRHERGLFGTEGAWLVEPRGPLWRRWRDRLADRDDDLRYRFPWMSRDEIAAELYPEK